MNFIATKTFQAKIYRASEVVFKSVIGMENSPSSTPKAERNAFEGPQWVDYLFACLLPVVCFFMWEIYLDPTWQSGDKTFIGLLMGPTWSWYFWPLLLVAAISLVMAGGKMTSMRYGLIQTGLYTGIVLGIHYSVLMSLSLFNDHSLFWVVGLVLQYVLSALVYGLLIKRPILLGWIVGVYLLVGGVVVMGGYFFNESTTLGSIFVPLLFFPVLGPGLYTLVFIRNSVEIRKWQHSNQNLLVWFLGWLGLYGAAWYFTWQAAVKFYAQLPVEPPGDCYIASAAAKGHRKWVKHEVVILPSGKPFLLNRQLQVLKTAELGIKALYPKGHRAMRMIYDRCGPFLVHNWVCRSKWHADLAYLFLKPVEWAANALIRFLFPEMRVSDVYLGSRSTVEASSFS